MIAFPFGGRSVLSHTYGAQTFDTPSAGVGFFEPIPELHKKEKKMAQSDSVIPDSISESGTFRFDFFVSFVSTALVEEREAIFC